MKPSVRSAAVIGGALVVFFAFAHSPAKADPHVPEQFCGNEGERSCGPAEGYPYFCDTGLALHVYLFRPDICGCKVRGPFGGCLIPNVCDRCINYTRRSPEIDLLFKGGWADWALKNQRELAQDEPLNWVMHLGTHNSFNTRADGHAFATLPNQVYSMTDQLRAGARLLTLDLYHLKPFGLLDAAARLCHSLSTGTAPVICAAPGDPLIYLGFPPSFRYYANGIKEIRNWLHGNPNEIIFLDFEDYDHLMGGEDEHVLAPIRTYLGDMVLRPPPVPPTKESGVFPQRWPTRREMLSAGHRVIVIDNHYGDFTFAQQNPVTKTYQPSEFLLNEGATISGSYNATDSPWLAKNLRSFPDCFTDDLTKNLFTKASIVVEEREIGAVIFGRLRLADIIDATQCNYSFIVLDRFSQLVVEPIFRLDPRPDVYTGVPDFLRQAAAVWSWKLFDTGQHGDCAMLEVSSERWVSADCGSHARFACARPRSESGLDPLEFEDPLGDNWRVTSAMGPWKDGPATCQTEFGKDGYVFGVPVNGYQNRRLKDASTGQGNLWLNYSQRNGDDKWVIGGTTNPVAKAGPDQVAECGHGVTLDAFGSYPRDGGLGLSYKWQGPFGTRTTRIMNLDTPRDLALGTNPIALSVTDSHGASATDSVTITVQDTTPPSMTLSLDAVYPSPRPNMVPVTATVTVSDLCDRAEPPRVQLVSIVSSNPTPGDVQGAEIGADDTEFKLGATLAGKTYTVTYRATDSSGNSTQTSAQIRVVKKPW